MKQYQEIIQKVLTRGVERTNRTNQTDIFIPSATIEVDLRDGFPALTTKQLFYKQSIGEILGFIRGCDNAADFRALGCNIWNSDANENKTWLDSPYRKGEDDLGKIYGATWRKRTVYKQVKYWNVYEDFGKDKEGNPLPQAKEEAYLQQHRYKCLNPTNVDRDVDTIYSKDIDQLRDVVNTIINNPNNRRIIMHAWFPELFDEIALPPCHIMYRFVPDKKNKVLHMSMFQRSCDLFLGVPFNLFGSSLLLKLIAEACGYKAGIFTHNMADVHLYENAIEQANAQLLREPMKLPTLSVTKGWKKPCSGTNDAMAWLESLEPDDIQLNDYNHCGKLDRVEMAQEK